MLNQKKKRSTYRMELSAHFASQNQQSGGDFEGGISSTSLKIRGGNCVFSGPNSVFHVSWFFVVMHSAFSAPAPRCACECARACVVAVGFNGCTGARATRHETPLLLTLPHRQSHKLKVSISEFCVAYQTSFISFTYDNNAYYYIIIYNVSVKIWEAHDANASNVQAVHVKITSVHYAWQAMHYESIIMWILHTTIINAHCVCAIRPCSLTIPWQPGYLLSIKLSIFT